MTLSAVIHYLVANWVELAGFVTTAVGIWLTTKRLLICWPVVLAADILYLIVFYRARLLSDALLQIFFIAFTLYGWWHWWRGVREEGEVRVVPLALPSLILALVAGIAATPCRAALSRRHPRQLQPRRQLVAGPQTHRQLVALDRSEPGLHRRVRV
jgi:nicotinamide mononucleotide transporter